VYTYRSELIADEWLLRVNADDKVWIERGYLFEIGGTPPVNTRLINNVIRVSTILRNSDNLRPRPDSIENFGDAWRNGNYSSWAWLVAPRWLGCRALTCRQCNQRQRDQRNAEELSGLVFAHLF
jgi:hypothetical protein